MGDPQHPLARPPEDAEYGEDGHWISPGAASRFRRLAWLLAFFIIVLGINALAAFDGRRVAYDALHKSERETAHRIAQNTANARANCEATNAVAIAAKNIVAGTGASLRQEDVDRISNPELRALVQNIVTRSAGSQEQLRQLGDAIPIQDCEAQARKAGAR